MQKPDEFALQVIASTTMRTDSNQMKFRKGSYNRNGENFLYPVSNIKSPVAVIIKKIQLIQCQGTENFF